MKSRITLYQASLTKSQKPSLLTIYDGPYISIQVWGLSVPKTGRLKSRKALAPKPNPILAAFRMV